MAFDLQLAARARKAVGKGAGVSEKEMFGGVAFMLNGNMFVGIVKDEFMVRVGKDAHDACLALPHARTMDFTGKPMRGYVFVAVPGIQTDVAVAAWVERGRGFAKTLPVKGADAPKKTSRSSKKPGGTAKKRPQAKSAVKTKSSRPRAAKPKRSK